MQTDRAKTAVYLRHGPRIDRPGRNMYLVRPVSWFRISRATEARRGGGQSFERASDERGRPVAFQGAFVYDALPGEKC